MSDFVLILFSLYSLPFSDSNLVLVQASKKTHTQKPQGDYIESTIYSKNMIFYTFMTIISK